jgi:hypothetical protein
MYKVLVLSVVSGLGRWFPAFPDSQANTVALGSPWADALSHIVMYQY